MWSLETAYCRKVTIMCNFRRKMTLGILLCLICVPLCIGQTDKVLSGRELLRAVRDKDAKNSSPKGVSGNADAGAATKHPTTTELLAKYTDTRDKFNSFTSKTENSIELETLPTSNDSRRGKSHRKYFKKIDFRFDGERVNLRTHFWGDVSPGQPTVPESDPHYTSLLSNENFERWYGTANSNEPGHMNLDKRAIPKEEHGETLARAYKGHEVLGYLYGDDERVDVVLRRARKISVRDKTERIGRSQCYVIDARSERGSYTLWIDTEHGHNIAKAEVVREGGDVFHRNITIQSGDSYRTSLSNVQFKKIDGVWIPVEADIKYINDSTNKFGYKSWENIHHKVTEFIMNPDHDALGSFESDDIRNGAKVEIVQMSGKHAWQDGKVVDAQGREFDLDSIKPKEPVSLLGKPLPSLEQFGAKLDPAELEGKKLLVCFWDMQQRPSRHVVLELVKRSEYFKEKGIEVVCVQASKVERGKLDEWVKENNIPYKVELIEADEEQTKYNWASKLLPWLILADEKHVVRAEGLSLDELADKIKELEDAGS
jgi:hypothetical protein